MQRFSRYLAGGLCAVALALSACATKDAPRMVMTPYHFKISHYADNRDAVVGEELPVFPVDIFMQELTQATNRELFNVHPALLEMKLLKYNLQGERINRTIEVEMHLRGTTEDGRVLASVTAGCRTKAPADFRPIEAAQDLADDVKGTDEAEQRRVRGYVRQCAELMARDFNAAILSNLVEGNVK